MSEEGRERSRSKQVLAEAKKRLKACIDAEAQIRAAALDDLEFLSASPDNPTQWPAEARKDRARTNRPALVVNRLDQFVQHIANAMRQNRVSARVFPVDDAGDVETAEVLQGVIRSIERASHGTLAYDTAAFYAVACGFGYWRQITEYCNPQSFDQEIKLERLPNPFQVYLGPHTMPDGSDAEFGFILTELTKEEYEAEHGKDSARGISWEGELTETWVSENSIWVVEYYRLRYEQDTLLRMRDGSTRLKSELAPEEEALVSVGEDAKPIERETKIPTCEWFKLNAVDVLDETVWPIPKIPIVKVTGHELTVKGKTVLKGIVRNLKDAQRMYNFMLSAETEAIDASKGQVVGYEGQFEGKEDQWARLNQQQVLEVKETTVAGQPAPFPTRLPPNLSIPAMTQARLMAAEDLKALTGVYDAALGAKSNETSGRGILARQQQSDTANYHFQDNLLLSIGHSTQMLVDLIPKIYDTARMVRIIGEDETQKIVRVNQAFSEDMKKFGQQRAYTLTTGKYDVVCTAGPAYQTKRREASEQMSAAFTAVPQLFPLAGDLYFRAQDWPYAQEIADRLRPPKDKKQEVPPEVQQQLAQMQRMVEVMTKELNAKNALIESKQQELDSKERIEMARLDVEREKIRVQALEAQQQLDSQEAIAALKAEVEVIKANVQANLAHMAQEADAASREMAQA